MTVLRLATRGSALALAQTKLVARMLEDKHPGLQTELVIISTQGDQDTEQPLWKMEGVGFFTTQLERALLDGKADVAVHSYKDLPTADTEGLMIAAVPVRENPADCVVSRLKIGSFMQIAPSEFVGTSSLRRQAQLLKLRPDLTIKTIRGNVNTRLRKMDEGQYDLLVMAAAGLLRLGLQDRISFLLESERFLPAPAQGALAVQVRTDDAATRNRVEAIDDMQTRTLVEAERIVLRRLHPGCHAPVGVYARRAGERIVMSAFASRPDGTEELRCEAEGDFAAAQAVAEELAETMISGGAIDILEEN